MFLSVVIFLFFSFGHAQYSYQQGRYAYNNFNPWSTYSTWNQGARQTQATVRGNLLNEDTSPLPYGSQISVSLVDVSLQDVASRPLNTMVLYGSYRFPIAFEIPYSMMQVQQNGNTIGQYAIQARIEKDGQLLYINDQYTPVQLIPAPINPVNVMMKKIGITTNPGAGGIYTTGSPITNNIYNCQQIPDVGPCRAFIEQYYFNSQLGSCQVFIWGGCGGNQNRFETRYDCERACSSYQRPRMSLNNIRQKWIQ
ncbi:unnamed protein product [Adineta ricciae]|uniref:BPTI/Kunitz inhibitor domain-containing protein n=1 Tax=Adineta ricciae TaxID=249248 RepID=A0A815X0H8_ADIRI|nr:unnamed protein product [Adineta ricciae]